MKELIRFGVTGGIFSAALMGWNTQGPAGMAIGLALSLALLAIPWWGQPLWSWVHLYVTRNRKVTLQEPVLVANDRSGGGVRYQHGVAVALVAIHGRAHRPTYLGGATETLTANILDISLLTSVMRQSLGLKVDSLSVVSAGSRRCSAGDYPRVYDTFIGPAPYAGQRQTWLIVRIRALDNGDALRCRISAGTAALAASQRIAAYLRTKGIRATVATPREICEIERYLGSSALELVGRNWHSARGDSGWLTTYAFRPVDINAESLVQPWTWRVDGIIENVTIFPDDTVCAAVTVQTPQPPPAPPSAGLQTLPGEQVPAIANNLCGPRVELRGQGRGALRSSLIIPIGPSGVLLGKLSDGKRLGLPLSDPGISSRVHLIADDDIAKRVIIRCAAAGERITVHTKDSARWDSVRMTHVAVSDQPRPVPGTTVSVVDGSVSPAPRPNTILVVSAPGAINHHPADVVIEQHGAGTVEVTCSGELHEAELEFFRAENRYASPRPLDGFLADHEMAK